MAAFGNVSADLMIGIPGQTRESLRASLDGLLEAGVRHLSVYLLEIEKAPRLVAAEARAGRSSSRTTTRWPTAGWRWTSAWRRPDFRATSSRTGRGAGFESRHNLKYWTLVPVLGFGVAAHSFDGKRRYANTGMLAEYLKRTRAGQIADRHVRRDRRFGFS